MLLTSFQCLVTELAKKVEELHSFGILRISSPYLPLLKRWSQSPGYRQGSGQLRTDTLSNRDRKFKRNMDLWVFGKRKFI